MRMIDGHCALTLNNQGIITMKLDQNTLDFIQYVQSLSKPKVFETGAACGNCAAQLAGHCEEIWINDISKEHLMAIEIEEEFFDNTRMFEGDFPDSFDLPKNYFDVFIARRIFHIFEGDKLRRAMESVYQSLKEGGSFFWMCDTPYNGRFKSQIAEYEKRKGNGDIWPGIVENAKEIFGEYNPPQGNLLDLDLMIRETERAKFKIQKSNYVNMKGMFPREELLDGRECAFVVGIK